MNTAQRDSWPTMPMPALCGDLPYRDSFSPEALATIQRGLLPRDMDDRWFMFYEDGRLNIHRSWKGTCVFVVMLDPATGEVTRCVVNRDPAQVRSQNDEQDLRLVRFLIHRLLLREDVPFPFPPDLPEERRAPYLFSIVGAQAR